MRDTVEDGNDLVGGDYHIGTASRHANLLEPGFRQIDLEAAFVKRQ